MFGIGMPELILILAIALIVLGPKKLPDLAKSMGRALREFKKATSEFKESIAVDDELSNVKKAFDDINKDIKETIDINVDLEDKAQNYLPSSDNEKDNKEPEKEGPEGSVKDE